MAPEAETEIGSTTPHKDTAPASPAGAQLPGKIYWLIPLLLACLQLFVTLASTGQIRLEELAESVRNVFWLDRGLIYDGASTNVGWYGTLLVWYRLFGFSLFSAKFVRLALHVIGLYCVAGLLRRRMSAQSAIVPLAVIGLSPTLLYFTSLQATFATDLPYAAICLLLLLSVRFESPTWLDLGKNFLCGFLAMIAAMSYPPFLCYLPCLLLVSFWRLRKVGAGLPGCWQRRCLLSGVAGFVLPLAVSFLLLRTPRLLIYDPVSNAGLFRGGGKIGLDPAVLRHSMATVLHDLFVTGHSYYYEVTHPDFSGILATASFGCVVATALYLLVTRKTDRSILWPAVLLLVINLVVPNISPDAGIRRCTGILAAYFVLFAVVWDYYLNTASNNSRLRRAGIVLCLLLPVSFALKYPSVLSDVRRPSAYRALDWFTATPTPTESLNYLLTVAEKEGSLVLSSRDRKGNPQPCRYQEIYAAVAGYRLWNGLTNINIQALDWKTGTNVTLTPSLWTEYYFPH